MAGVCCCGRDCHACEEGLTVPETLLATLNGVEEDDDPSGFWDEDCCDALNGLTFELTPIENFEFTEQIPNRLCCGWDIDLGAYEPEECDSLFIGLGIVSIGFSLCVSASEPKEYYLQANITLDNGGLTQCYKGLTGDGHYPCDSINETFTFNGDDSDGDCRVFDCVFGGASITISSQ